jgi:hypothetical protein
MSRSSLKFGDLALNAQFFWLRSALGRDRGQKYYFAFFILRPRSGTGPPRPREKWRVSAFCLVLWAALSDGAASAPGKVARQRLKKSRPISRVLSRTVIPLAYASPRSSSDLPGSPCGPHVAAIKPLASLFGLAPGGVCRAVGVATRAVRSYRTISPLPAPLARHLGGIFLLHFP